MILLTHSVVVFFFPLCETRLLTVEERKEIGSLCKLVIDHGRIRYLQHRGYKAALQHYTDSSVSLENVLLTAVPETTTWQDADLELAEKLQNLSGLYKKQIWCLQKTSFTLSYPKKRFYISQFDWKLKICKAVLITRKMKSLRILETNCKPYC